VPAGRQVWAVYTARIEYLEGRHSAR
jgi:hypothetical protein